MIPDGSLLSALGMGRLQLRGDEELDQLKGLATLGCALCGIMPLPAGSPANVPGVHAIRQICPTESRFSLQFNRRAWSVPDARKNRQTGRKPRQEPGK
jgi:hypothetical protein